MIIAGSAEGANKAYDLAKACGHTPVLIDCTGLSGRSTGGPYLLAAYGTLHAHDRTAHLRDGASGGKRVSTGAGQTGAAMPRFGKLWRMFLNRRASGEGGAYPNCRSRRRTCFLSSRWIRLFSMRR